MANDQRKDDQRFSDKQNAKPLEIKDEDLEPVVGGVKANTVPGTGTDPCLT